MALASAKFIGVVTGTHLFVKRDLFRHLRLDSIAPNVLDLHKLTNEFVTKLVHHPPFLNAAAQSELEVSEKFVSKVTPDIGAGITPNMVYGYAKMVTGTYIESILGLEKGYGIPSERMVMATASRHTSANKTKWERRAKLALYSDLRGKLLQNTSIYSFSELLPHLQEQNEPIR